MARLHGTSFWASRPNIAHGVCPPLTAKVNRPCRATGARARSATYSAALRATASGLGSTSMS
jgi:hypothetical protein